MAAMTGKDFEKLQQQMSERLAQFLKTPAAGDGPGLPQEDPHALLEEARANLESAIHDRDEALRLANARIDRKKREVAALESSIKRVGQTADKGKGKPKR